MKGRTKPLKNKRVEQEPAALELEHKTGGFKALQRDWKVKEGPGFRRTGSRGHTSGSSQPRPAPTLSASFCAPDQRQLEPFTLVHIPMKDFWSFHLEGQNADVMPGEVAVL
ncbi:hypothetical protein CB1_001652057 [Camelus ferus]|nr:hypothetical protein CB1_001652057 [Camelus ferus]